MEKECIIFFEDNVMLKNVARIATKSKKAYISPCTRIIEFCDDVVCVSECTTWCYGFPDDEDAFAVPETFTFWSDVPKN